MAVVCQSFCFKGRWVPGEKLPAQHLSGRTALRGPLRHKPHRRSRPTSSRRAVERSHGSGGEADPAGTGWSRTVRQQVRPPAGASSRRRREPPVRPAQVPPLSPDVELCPPVDAATQAEGPAEQVLLRLRKEEAPQVGPERTPHSRRGRCPRP